MTEQLITKYRPQRFSEVIGNARVIRALENEIKSKSRFHGYLLTGPSGVGKTTLAHIIAKEIDASIVEFDAASDAGVDATRRVARMCQFSFITPEPNRLFIIDECHAFSRVAWNPFLSLLENPYDNYFAFCTTDPTDIPETIKTRCFPVALERVGFAELQGYGADMAQRLGWPITNDVLKEVVLAANGSPRMVLTKLAAHATLISQAPVPERKPVDRAQEERLNPIDVLHHLRAKEGR